MGESLLRATVSVRGVVCAPDDEVLVIRRASDGGWELPGGRIRKDEDVTACLSRELTEETGLDPSVHRPVHTVTWRNDSGDGRLAVYYECTTASREVSVSEEHVDYTWEPPEAAVDRLSEPQGTAVARVAGVGGAPSERA